MQLVYVADPLCSWCYGFGPQLARLLEDRPQAQVDLVMGGLRPFDQEPMTQAFRDMLRGHWRQVGEACGLPFDESLLERDGFVYDTEPACRAVVTARTLDASRALAYLKAVQRAFYAEGRDATDAEVLAAIARETGYDTGGFAEALGSAAMREETLRDFATTRTLGVNGFPTLGVGHGKQLYLVSSGYSTAEVLDERLREIAVRIAEAGAPG